MRELVFLLFSGLLYLILAKSRHASHSALLFSSLAVLLQMLADHHKEFCLKAHGHFCEAVGFF